MSDVLRLSVRPVFRGKRRVLGSQVMSLPRGTNVALAGLNGAGKTSLFLALVGGLRGTRRPEGAGALAISYLPQSVAVPEALTAEDFGELACGVPFRRLDSVFPDFELGRFRARRLSGLSQGERQLLVCLLALTQPADLVLLDEPMASLDMKRRSQLRQVIRDRRGLAAETVLILASPVPSELGATCEHLVTITGGMITNHGPLAGFLERQRGNGAEAADLEEAILAAVN